MSTAARTLARAFRDFFSAKATHHYSAGVQSVWKQTEATLRLELARLPTRPRVFFDIPEERLERLARQVEALRDAQVKLDPELHRQVVEQWGAVERAKMQFLVGVPHEVLMERQTVQLRDTLDIAALRMFSSIQMRAAVVGWHLSSEHFFGLAGWARASRWVRQRALEETASVEAAIRQFERTVEPLEGLAARRAVGRKEVDDAVQMAQEFEARTPPQLDVRLAASEDMAVSFLARSPNVLSFPALPYVIEGILKRGQPVRSAPAPGAVIRGLLEPILMRP